MMGVVSDLNGRNRETKSQTVNCFTTEDGGKATEAICSKNQLRTCVSEVCVCVCC